MEGTKNMERKGSMWNKQGKGLNNKGLKRISCMKWLVRLWLATDQSSLFCLLIKPHLQFFSWIRELCSVHMYVWRSTCKQWVRQESLSVCLSVVPATREVGEPACWVGVYASVWSLVKIKLASWFGSKVLESPSVWTRYRRDERVIESLNGLGWKGP